MMIGFSPRKTMLVLYGLAAEEKTELLPRLGKHTTGRGCISINSLAHVDVKVLEALMSQSVKAVKARSIN
jgi:hypothetical protein